MPWDAWALMLLTLAEAMVFIACLAGDNRNSGRYGKRDRGRHRRGRKGNGGRREVDGSWICTNGWKAATSGTGNRR